MKTKNIQKVLSEISPQKHLKLAFWSLFIMAKNDFVSVAEISLVEVLEKMLANEDG